MEEDKAAQPTPQITALLQAYEQVLEFAADMPRTVFLKRRCTRIGWCVRVPRLRWRLKFFLVLHIRRTVVALKRRCYGLKYAPDTPDSCQPDLDTLTAFEQSLPSTTSVKVTVFALVLSVFFVSFVVADYALPGTGHIKISFLHCNQNKKADQAKCNADRSVKTVAAKPLGTMAGAILTVDRTGLVDGIKSFACDGPFSNGKRWRDCTVARTVSSSLIALFLLPATIWFLLILPMTSLRLKRVLFLSRPRSLEELKALYAAEPTPHEDSIYALEARAFESLNGRRVPEVPFDLASQAVLMVPLLFPGVAVLAYDGYGIWFVSQYYSDGDAVAITGLMIFGTLLLLGPIGRLVALRRMAVRRANGQEERGPRGASWWRRVGAHLVDALVVGVIWTGLGLLVYDLVGQVDLKWILIVFVGPPVSASIYQTALFLAGAPWAGRTLGKRLTGLRVVGDDHAPPSFPRLLVRESLLKWLLFPVFVLPALANFVWPLWDYRRRAWHDIVTGTVVVRAEPAPEAATAAEAQPAPV